MSFNRVFFMTLVLIIGSSREEALGKTGPDPAGHNIYEVGLLKRFVTEYLDEDEKYYHHDVLTRMTQENNITLTRRGLFADDFIEAILGGVLYYAILTNPDEFPGEDPKDWGWVDGTVADQGVWGDEQMDLADEERYSVVRNRIIQKTGPRDYHIVLFNCQNWAAKQLE